MESYHEALLDAIGNLRREMKNISYEIYKDAELTLPQLGVVAVLTEGGSMKVSDVSKRVGLANSTVSGIVDRLVKKGIIERTRLKEDRRTVVLSLTEGSERFYEEYKEMRNAFILEKLKDLEPHEAEGLTGSLNRLIELLF